MRHSPSDRDWIPRPHQQARLAGRTISGSPRVHLSPSLPASSRPQCPLTADPSTPDLRRPSVNPSSRAGAFCVPLRSNQNWLGVAATSLLSTARSARGNPCTTSRIDATSRFRSRRLEEAVGAALPVALRYASSVVGGQSTTRVSTGACLDVMGGLDCTVHARAPDVHRTTSGCRSAARRKPPRQSWPSAHDLHAPCLPENALYDLPERLVVVGYQQGDRHLTPLEPFGSLPLCFMMFRRNRLVPLIETTPPEPP